MREPPFETFEADGRRVPELARFDCDSRGHVPAVVEARSGSC
jgi:hypothetical protein